MKFSILKLTPSARPSSMVQLAVVVVTLFLVIPQYARGYFFIPPTVGSPEHRLRDSALEGESVSTKDWEVLTEAVKLPPYEAWRKLGYMVRVGRNQSVRDAVRDVLMAQQGWQEMVEQLLSEVYSFHSHPTEWREIWDQRC